MKRLAIYIVSLLSLNVYAQNVKTCSDEEFRELMRELVSEGNRQYEKSYRLGIKENADKLLHFLEERGEAGRLHPNDSLEFYADWYKLVADWYYEHGNYDPIAFKTCLTYLDYAMNIINRNPVVFKDRIDCAPMIHREYAQLFYRTGEYEKALKHMQQAMEMFDAAMEMDLLTDEDYTAYNQMKTQLAMCYARTGNADEAFKQIDSVLKLFKKGSEDYYETLRKKAKILMLGGGDKCGKTALPLYQQYMRFRHADALQTLGGMTSEQREDYWMRMRPFVADCYQLEDADPAFLYDVTLFSKGLLLQINRLSGLGPASSEALATINYSWKQIQKRLPKDGCAIEFVQYEKNGKQKMAALVLGKKGQPQWVEMMSPADFFSHRCAAVTVETCLYTNENEKKDILYNDTTLYPLIWNEALCKAIAGCRKVYFAPDGYLHQVAVEYMLPAELAEIKPFRLTSTRRLLDNPIIRTGSALIVGGVEYDFSIPDTRTVSNDALAFRYMQSLNASFQYLVGTKMECDSIYACRKNKEDQLLTDLTATEQTFRTLCKNYNIVHLSTHGCFAAYSIPQGTDLKPCLQDESMSQSIIALSGANHSVKDNSFNTNELDGILSARELSETDMKNVYLAVISACQTGLGYVTADGVYGIQRGLKNAGVGAMLVSLWSVNDYSTCLLMSRFYKLMQEGYSIYDAFSAARSSFEKEVVAEGSRFSAARLKRVSQPDKKVDFTKPQHKNAFILIDAFEL